MSQYYNPKRTRNLYMSKAKESFRISRSKVDLFLECPKCFYLDRRLGVARPPGFPFSLNSAVDALLKKEFDAHRTNGIAHPLMKEYGIDAVPFQHEKMNEWRDALRGGVVYLHEPTNFLVTGGVDDIWVNPKGELMVVDYKATSKSGEVTLDAEWQDGYKRQMEFYQWLLRKNGFTVSSLGYFVYCNGDADKEAFDAKLEFDIKIISYIGDDNWIEPTLLKIKEVLEDSMVPKAHADCDYCRYRGAVEDVAAILVRRKEKNEPPAKQDIAEKNTLF